jgi:hypothetical protein
MKDGCSSTFKSPREYKENETMSSERTKRNASLDNIITTLTAFPKKKQNKQTKKKTLLC